MIKNFEKYDARATCYNFFPQVSADNSAEEADHIETNKAAFICSAAIFSSRVFWGERTTCPCKIAVTCVNIGSRTDRIR